MAIYSDFSHLKWWFSIAMLVMTRGLKFTSPLKNGTVAMTWTVFPDVLKTSFVVWFLDALAGNFFKNWTKLFAFAGIIIGFEVSGVRRLILWNSLSCNSRHEAEASTNSFIHLVELSTCSPCQQRKPMFLRVYRRCWYMEFPSWFHFPLPWGWSEVWKRWCHLFRSRCGNFCGILQDWKQSERNRNRANRFPWLHVFQ